MMKLRPHSMMMYGIIVNENPNRHSPMMVPCTLAMHGGQPNKGLQKVSDVCFSSQSATGPRMWSLLNTA